MDYRRRCVLCGGSAVCFVIIDGVKRYICCNHKNMLMNLSEEEVFRIVRRTIDAFLEIQEIGARFEEAIEKLAPKRR